MGKGKKQEKGKRLSYCQEPLHLSSASMDQVLNIMGFSFNPHSILKEGYCLLVYYLVPLSLLECQLLGRGGIGFAHHYTPTLDRGAR